jgi:hypothetical protein
VTFKPGASGNPRGRPKKGGAFAELLERELARPFEDGVSKKERMVAVAVAEACKGDLDALKWIVDRTEGKVTDKVEQSGTVTTRIQVDYGDGDVRADD